MKSLTDITIDLAMGRIDRVREKLQRAIRDNRPVSREVLRKQVRQLELARDEILEIAGAVRAYRECALSGVEPSTLRENT
jgi:hypothetical protein